VEMNKYVAYDANFNGLLAGLHRTYISSVERGERNVTLTTIERLSSAQGVTMRDLIPKQPKSTH